MQRADHKISVTVDDRKFTVHYDADGNPLRISERRIHNGPYSDTEYNAPYWHHKHGSSGKNPKNLPDRIFAAAKLKLETEDRIARATP